MKDNKITIVTAFFDIGRGDWTAEKGYPDYLVRSTDTYMERFSYMASLDNHIIVYTSPDQVEKIQKLNRPNVTIIEYDYATKFDSYKKDIQRIQNDLEYQSIIAPWQKMNPEYWNVDYVTINRCKTHFVIDALSKGIIETDAVAWLDFGYCRKPVAAKSWCYNFEKDRMHFWYIPHGDRPIDTLEINNETTDWIISNNRVYTIGSAMVGELAVWPRLYYSFETQWEQLVKRNRIDDDQTLMLLAYLDNPKDFCLHPIDPSDWFRIFEDFNQLT